VFLILFACVIDESDAHMKGSCRMYERTAAEESCNTYGWVMLHIPMRHVTQENTCVRERGGVGEADPETKENDMCACMYTPIYLYRYYLLMYCIYGNERCGVIRTRM